MFVICKSVSGETLRRDEAPRKFRNRWPNAFALLLRSPFPLRRKMHRGKGQGFSAAVIRERAVEGEIERAGALRFDLLPNAGHEFCHLRDVLFAVQVGGGQEEDVAGIESGHEEGFVGEVFADEASTIAVDFDNSRFHIQFCVWRRLGTPYPYYDAL